MAEKLTFEIEVDDNGSVKMRRFARTLDDTGRSSKRFAGSAGALASRLAGLVKGAASAAIKIAAVGAAAAAAAGAFAAWQVKRLAASFIDTGAAMDKLRVSLDTITKGQGAEWFDKLNRWALKMPINTVKAIKAFTMMRAMGLKPTIDDMTTLVDTTSALGGEADTLEGIARALGQIKTKGKVSAEELMQLAERGVPAYQILQEKLGLTAEQLGNIGAAGIDANTAVTALLEGMSERFGGQSKKIQGMWSGMIESLKSYWVEFKRLVMDSGVMAWLEENLRAIVDWADELYNSGTMQQWAQDLADYIIGLGERIKAFVGQAIGGWHNLEETVRSVFANIRNWADQLLPSLKAVLTVAGAVARAINVTGKAIGNAAGRLYTDAERRVNEIAASKAKQAAPAKAPSYASGTGPAGLPYTGLFLGHKGEIVKNPAESEAERRGRSNASGGNTYILQPTFMTGDAGSIARAFAEFRRLEKRWGTV